MFLPVVALLATISFDMTIGIGSIINVAVLVVGFLASWYKLQNQAASAQKELEENIALTEKLDDQMRLLALTVEKLSTITEFHEKMLDNLQKRP